MLVWIGKYSKRFLRQPLFLLLLVLLPIGTMTFSYLAHQKSTAVRVGLVWEDGGEMESEIAEQLMGHKGIASFVRCDSDKGLKEQIAEGELECGYCFPSGMEQRLAKGEYKGLITQYYRAGMSLHFFVSETVFAAVYDRYGERLVRDYVMDSGLYSTYSLAESQITGMYKEQHEKQSTFTFTYDEGTPVQRSFGDYLTAPLKGIMALIILLAGFCGVIVWLEDKRKGMEMAAPFGIRRFLPFLSAGIPVVSLSIAGILSEAVSRLAVPTLKEVACMLIYDIMVILFVVIFSYSGLSGKTMWGISLCTVFAGAVSTPVFVNLPAVIPGVGMLSWLCPPAYYLRAVYGGVRAAVFMLAATALLFAVCCYFQRRRERT